MTNDIYNNTCKFYKGVIDTLENGIFENIDDAYAFLEEFWDADCDLDSEYDDEIYNEIIEKEKPTDEEMNYQNMIEDIVLIRSEILELISKFEDEEIDFETFKKSAKELA